MECFVWNTFILIPYFLIASESILKAWTQLWTLFIHVYTYTHTSIIKYKYYTKIEA